MKTLNEIEMRIKSIIESQNLAVSSDFVIDYWSSKGWRTKKGTPVKSFEVAVHVCNSIYVTRMRKADALQPSIF